MLKTAVSVQNLGKQYHIGQIQSQPDSFIASLGKSLTAPLRRTRKLLRGQSSSAAELTEVIWALQDVSFDVSQGEVVGIIGRNGAGKSTLLKILSRITEPTQGRAIIYGRVGSLLEVGTGFHDELTGRENVFLNGTVLGMKTREIAQKFDEIIEFSGIDKFIDTPVKHYSSGMKVRLAFAVAAHLEPEILIIDEVLAVGDAGFQKKSLGKMQEVTQQERTVLFVSHQMDMVRAICDRCILLENGMIRAAGRPDEVIDIYIQSLGLHQQSASFTIEEDPAVDIQILHGWLVDKNGQSQVQFDVFDQIILELDYVIHKPVLGSVINFELKRNGATLFLSFDTDTEPERLESRAPGYYHCRIALPRPLLKSGYYSLTLRTGLVNSQKSQLLEEAIKFDVQLLSKPSSFLSYADRRRGLIAVPLDWETSLVEPLLSESHSAHE